MVRDSITSCPESEIYTQCGKRSEPNCDISDESPPNFHMCVPGCVCPKGTFRQGTSKCVLREQCELCPEGEVLVKCSGTFQSHYHWLPTYCVSKCVCPERSLRELKSGKCVSEQEYYKPTEKPHLNYFTPGFILQIVIIFAISLAYEYQLSGASRGDCPNGEYFIGCEKDCEPTCDNPVQPESCFLSCMSGCVCPRGTFRQGRSELCPEGEVLTKCSGTFQSHDHRLASYCVSECVCREKSLRDVESGRCIPEYDDYVPVEKPHLDYFTLSFFLKIVFVFSISLLLSFFVMFLLYLSILGQLYLFRRPVPTVPVSENDNLISGSYL
ncbi:trypsin inhibitor like cysteine rich domain-containing protein [Ditylenchus destructor]|nr:trypsin inhibitor like cysteine rich domain-containing protein [Ditylenchus destructor]